MSFISCSSWTVTSRSVDESSVATVVKPRLSVSPLSKLIWWPTIFFPFLEVPSVCRVVFHCQHFFSCLKLCQNMTLISNIYCCLKTGEILLKQVCVKCFATVLITVLHLLAGTLPSPWSSIRVCRIASEKRFFSSLMPILSALSASPSMPCVWTSCVWRSLFLCCSFLVLYLALSRFLFSAFVLCLSAFSCSWVAASRLWRPFLARTLTFSAVTCCFSRTSLRGCSCWISTFCSSVFLRILLLDSNRDFHLISAEAEFFHLTSPW